MKQVRVGVIGFGTVGAGVVDCLLRHGDLIGERTGVRPVLTRVADLDVTTNRGVAVPASILTTDAGQVLDGADIDIVVELVGGTTVAREFILRAMANRKPVVTANKALLAKHGAEIFAAAEANGVDLCYEASVAGGIPIIKALREGLVANRLREIVGILNGTCNYILTRMESEGALFETVLKAAQKAGYAEADPGLDIDGIDTAHKATILASLAFGRWCQVDQIHVEGIRGLALQEIHYAAVLGYRIKLLAVLKEQDGKAQLRVHPTLIPARSLLGNVNGVFNAVWVRGEPVGDTLYYGRGAGRDPTSSAVVADIVDVGLNQQFASSRRVSPFRTHGGQSGFMPMSEVRTRYYLRLQAVDRPGVLALVAGILGRANISIASVTQKETDRRVVPMVILTHHAREADMQTALAEIRGLTEVVPEPPVMIRIEDLP